jgi:hypothetical protein
MSWGAQSRSEDAKTPSTPRGRSEKPELDLCPVQPHNTVVSDKYRMLVPWTETGDPGCPLCMEPLLTNFTASGLGRTRRRQKVQL